MATQLTLHDKIQRFNYRLNELVSIRQPWEPIWQEAIDYTGPRKVGIQTVMYNQNEGQSTGQLMYDGTAGMALQLFTDGLQGYSISPAFPWFSLNIPYSLPSVRNSARQEFKKRVDELPEVKHWLEDKQEVMYGACKRSNIYEEISSFLYSGIQVGTAVMYVEEDLDRGRTVFSDRHPSEFFIAENRFGDVDTVFRKFNMSVKQLVEKFGKENLTVEIRNDYENGRLGGLHEVIHAVFPKRDWYGNGNYFREWLSVYKLKKDANNLLSESGYAYFPYIVWRYRKNTFETYGRGPAIDSMVENLGLQQISKDLLQAAHNATFGVWSAPEEMRGRVRISAKGINYYQDINRQIRQINTDIKFPFGEDREQRKIEIIQKHFNVDFFMMLANSERQMTATEIIERQGEKAAILGPVIGRLNSECFNPLIDIVDFIETRAGRMPPPPDVLVELAGNNIEVDYCGPLAEAQKRLFQSRGINNLLATVGQVAQVSPEILDNIDFDVLVQETAEANSVSPKIIRPKEMVAMIRAKREQQQQAMQQAQVAMEAAKTVPALNQPVQEGSPLEAIGEELANQGVAA